MKTVVFFLTLLFVITLSAQIPQKLSYQAVIRNNANILLINKVVGMRISIIQDSMNSVVIYQETHNPTTNLNGLVSLEIGNGKVSLGSFDSINWGHGPHFVKTETDPNGGNNYSIIGISQLVSVPYALYAERAGKVSGELFQHYIGEHYGGGVIYHLWKDSLSKEHGLIVDLVDLSNSQKWSNVSTIFSGIEAQSVWNGLKNSEDIVKQIGHSSSAALMCLNSTNGGQNDWYLPSSQELNQLWSNYYTVSKELEQIQGAVQLSSLPYWSSTVWSTTNEPFFFKFYSGDIVSASKSSAYSVRAVRSF